MVREFLQPSQDCYEDMVMHDLLTRAEERFSIDTTRRALAGLSMGGYGAILLALRHPHRFRFAASLSGALSIPSWIEFPEQYHAERSIANLEDIFGPPGSFRRNLDPFHLVATTDASSLPFIYLVMGTNDGFTSFLTANRALADSLRTRGIRYEYHETPGGHNWQYWGREIHPLLNRLSQILSETR